MNIALKNVSPTLKSVLVRHLATLGHQVTDLEGSAPVAIPWVPVVITEIERSQEDDLAWAGEIAHRCPGVSIVALTSQAADFDPVVAARRGVVTLLRKPLALAELELLLLRLDRELGRPNATARGVS